VPISKLAPTLSNLRPGVKVAPGSILFEKVQTAEALAEQAAATKAKKEALAKAAEKKAARAAAVDKQQAAAGGAAEDELAKVDMRVAQILEVSRHDSADALYVEKIDVGEAAPRQVVSGLVKHMSADQLQGRRVVLVANMKPSKMRGVESQV
jgi:methionine--tRNA ligase beta chain